MKRLLDGLRELDWRVVLALVYTAAMLMALEQWFLPSRIEGRLRALPGVSSLPPSLDAGLVWVGASTAGYLLVPLLIVLLIHREAPASVGFRWRGFARHVLVYLALYLLMLPALLLAGRQEAFLGTYPLVKPALRSLDTFLRWELAYVVQFFALEAFFRGYLLFTLERRLGWHAIFVMTVPYCMIHVHKPPAEAFGSIGAGLVLGALALRYRSWYGGALLHALVAVTMDLLAAAEAGLFRT